MKAPTNNINSNGIKAYKQANISLANSIMTLFLTISVIEPDKKKALSLVKKHVSEYVNELEKVVEGVQNGS